MGRIPRRGIRRAGTQHGRLRPLRQGQRHEHLVRAGRRLGHAGRQRQRNARRHVVRTERQRVRQRRDDPGVCGHLHAARRRLRRMDRRPGRQRHDRPDGRTYAGLLLPGMDRACRPEIHGHAAARQCRTGRRTVETSGVRMGLRRQLFDGGPDRNDQPPAHQRRRDGRRFARQLAPSPSSRSIFRDAAR